MLTVAGGGGTFPLSARRISMTTQSKKMTPATTPMRLYKRRRTDRLATQRSPRRRQHQYSVQNPHRQADGGRADMRKHGIQPRPYFSVDDYLLFHRTTLLPRTIGIDDTANAG